MVEMIHKIQTSENSYVSLEVKLMKSSLCLYISKGPSSLLFNHQETKQLNAIVQVQGATAPLGRFRVYLGAPTPGDTTGGVLAADSGDLAVGPEADISVTGLPVLNPGGACQVQVTGEVSAPGVGNGVNTASIRGVTVYSL